MSKSNSLGRVGRRKIHEIYMDYSASASPNPSSIHTQGVKAKNELENARKEVAEILNSKPAEIIFTSGGTESNNIAIQGIVNMAREQGFLPHIVTTNIEHPSVLQTFKILEKRKLAEISIVSVEGNGIVDSKKIKKEIKENTVLVSVMYANNEIGTIQPIKEIAKEIRYFRKTKQMNNLRGPRNSLAPNPGQTIANHLFALFPVFHTDAVQAVNYLDLNVEKLGVDLLSISGTKIEGAGRVGILYKRKNVTLASVYGGGDQELGLRPGTENLQEILKFSEAFKKVHKIKDKETKRLTVLRDYFIEKLQTFQTSGSRRAGYRRLEFPLQINGDLKNRLPNNVNITFPKIPSDLLVIELSAKGIMASSKSACKSSRADGSYVIKAICPRTNSEIGGLRFSLGRQTTKKDINDTIKALSLILTKLKKWYN